MVHKLEALIAIWKSAILFAFHLFDFKWTDGASCARDDRARSENYKPQESWRKHELVMRSRDSSYISYDRTDRLSLSQVIRNIKGLRRSAGA